MICLGRRGQVALIADGRATELDVPLLRESADQRGFISSCAVSDDRLVAAGLGGQVFTAEFGGTPLPSNWQEIGPGIPASDEGFEADFGGSFFGVGAFGPAEIYVVGMGGVMRRYDGAEWRQLDVGTNANLFAVLCVPDGHVYAAGQNGVLVRGRGDLWEVVDLEPLADAVVRSLAWFRGSLWIGAEEGLFRYDGQGIAPVEPGAARGLRRRGR
jgi:photosystem II stability/assembly factor-like uncharacterized protein